MLSRKTAGTPSSGIARPGASKASAAPAKNENFLQRWYRVYYADPVMRAKIVSRAQNFGMFVGASLLIRHYGSYVAETATEAQLPSQQQQ